MEKIVRCIECGYCDVDSWGAWCNKENVTLDELLEEKEQLKQRAEPELRPLMPYELKNRCKSPL